MQIFYELRGFLSERSHLRSVLTDLRRMSKYVGLYPGEGGVNIARRKNSGGKLPGCRWY